ncbi:MAG: TRAP transporter substrate-binding protein [Betaproteobacteria bacterium]|nr:TRAP transporter substrate-binding protein [Betaproteobacteria bacterium]MBI2961804.1 TRAP transporter substrate-binding protein [Betaproteobacteria bacterium]
MKSTLSVAFVAASLFAAGAVLGQTKPAMNVLVGVATANDTQAEIAEKFAELMTKYSGGRLKASARQGEALGSNAQMLAAMQAGSVHGLILPSGFMAPIVPELALFDLPFLVPGAPAKMTAFASQSKAAARMTELAAQKGISVMGFHGIGPSNLVTKFPVNAISDLQGKRFRVIPSPPRVGAYQDWGAVARPMELGEVYTALQQGTLDGVEMPPDVFYKMKYFEVTKFYTLTAHTVFFSGLLASKKWLDGLPKDLQDAVNRAGKDTIAFADTAYTRAQDTSLTSLRKVIAVRELPSAELQKMKDVVRKGVWERMKNDPQRGPMVRLLEEDVARFSKM